MPSEHQFGSSPAAICLSQILENDFANRRKVSRLLQGYNEKLNDIVFSNLPGPTKVWAVNTLVRSMTELVEKQFSGEVGTFTSNVVKFHYKMALRTIAAKGERNKRGQLYSKYAAFKQTTEKSNAISRSS